MPAGYFKQYRPKKYKIHYRRRPKTVDAKQNKEIKVLKKQVKKLTKVSEKKWLDENGTYTISSTPFVVNLTAPDVYVDTNSNKHRTREGNSIVLTNMTFKGILQMQPAGTVAPLDASNRIRIIVVRMHDTPAIPSISDILQSNTMESFYRIQGNLKYTRCYDRVFNLTNLFQVSSGSSSAVGSSHENWRAQIRFSLKKKIGKNGLKVEYAQGSGSGANPINNGFYLFAFSDSTAPQHPSMRLQWRTRFDD